ncbi:MAG: hypothetical protein P8H39_07560 [Thalassotalea sp.]|nr:hypothetical protein [Thalassotalea sp.]
MKFVKVMSLVAIFSVLTLPLKATAVDGYKDLKFGMSKAQIIAKNICTLEDMGTVQDGIEFYGCEDFIFGGELVELGIFFIDDKFLRVAIMPSIDLVAGLSKGLVKKYGSPSSSSTQKQFQAVDAEPNREAFLAFDKDTVFLNITSDEYNMQMALLIYTSPEYEKLMYKMQQESIDGDL